MTRSQIIASMISPVFFRPCLLVWPGFEPTGSFSADQWSPNRSNWAVVTLFCFSFKSTCNKNSCWLISICSLILPLPRWQKLCWGIRIRKGSRKISDLARSETRKRLEHVGSQTWCGIFNPRGDKGGMCYTAPKSGTRRHRTNLCIRPKNDHRSVQETLGKYKKRRCEEDTK